MAAADRREPPSRWEDPSNEWDDIDMPESSRSLRSSWADREVVERNAADDALFYGEGEERDEQEWVSYGRKREENRAIVVREFDPETTIDDIRRAFETYGPIQQLSAWSGNVCALK
jgi:hypothetical protein